MSKWNWKDIKRELAITLISLPTVIGGVFMCFDRLEKGTNVKENLFPLLLGYVISTLVKAILKVLTNWLD